MAQKKRRRKNKSGKQKAAQTVPQATKEKLAKKIYSKLLSWWRGGWRAFLFVATIIGFVSAFYIFIPKIQIVPYASLNPSYPFATPFLIVNNSVFSVGSVEPFCALNEVETTNHWRFSKMRSTNLSAKIKKMRSGESSAVFCDFPANATPILTADIEICVKYIPKFYPFKQEKCTRFVTQKAFDDNLVWLPKALE